METHTTIWAGTGVSDHEDGRIESATFNEPRGVVFNDRGDLFVCDSNNHRIRKINGHDGTVSTFAGESIDKGEKLHHPIRIACARDGEIFVVDGRSSSIKRISKNGTVRILMEKEQVNGTTREFVPALHAPRGLALDTSQQNLFLAVIDHSIIQEICLATEMVTTIAGTRKHNGNSDGIGSEATFSSPYGIALDKKTGDFFVVDNFENHVRKLSRVNVGGKEEWMVTSIQIVLPHINDFYCVAVFRDTLFLAAWRSGNIVQSSLDGKQANILARLPERSPHGLAVDASGVYVSVHVQNVISKIELPRLFWSSDSHQYMHWHTRKLVGVVVLASLCQSNLSTARCPLRRLPREILFHTLSFLDSSYILTAE
jgi:DNA-binding beta-propeller fold protein YncE